MSMTDSFRAGRVGAHEAPILQLEQGSLAATASAMRGSSAGAAAAAMVPAAMLLPYI